MYLRNEVTKEKKKVYLDQTGKTNTCQLTDAGCKTTHKPIKADHLLQLNKQLKLQ